MPTDNSPAPAVSIEIDGERLYFVDHERLAILKDALGESKLVELTQTARQSLLDSVVELRANWQAGDAPSAGRSAHRLAGVCANFGWPALAAIARLIERSCRDGSDGRRYEGQFDEILASSLGVSPAD